MHLFFDALDITAFKAYRDPAHIPLERMGLGLWFVKGTNLVNPRLGSNGAAKSTIFDCLSWVLYGRSIGGHRTPDMKGWHEGAKPPEASLTISAGPTMSELDKYVIKRKGVSNGLWLDGKVVSQETIDRLIGLSFANFLHTVVLGQGKALFFDLSATEKMDVLSETLNLNKWDDRIGRARKEVTGLESERTRLDADYQACVRAIAKAEDSIDDLKEKSRTWENERADADEAKRRTILDLEKQLEKHQRNLGDADLAFDSAETELRHSQASLDQAQADARVHINARANANAKLNAALNVVEDVHEKRRNLLDGDTCPTCKQELDAKAIKAHKAQLNRELDDAEDAVASARKKFDEAKAADEEAKRRENQHAADIKRFRNASNEAVDARTRAQGNVNRVKAELDAYKKVRTENEEKVNPYAALIVTARQDLNDAKADKAALNKKLTKLDKRIGLTRYWIDGFKQVRLYLIDEVLAELEGVTQTLLSSVGLDSWRVRYDIDKETKSGTVKPGLNVSIFQPEYDRAVKWELFSGGESQRLRLIGAVALSEVLLRRAGVRCELLVLDEPTRHLSPEGVRDTADFLIDRANAQQVFYIDHAAIDTNRMSGVIKVTRDDKGARLEWHR